jgi:hypothetical protein
MSQMNCLVAEDRERVKNRNTHIIEGERSESRCINATAHLTGYPAPVTVTEPVY